MAEENIRATVDLNDQLSRPAGRAEDAVDDLTRSVEELDVALAASSAASGRMSRALAVLRSNTRRAARETDDHSESVRRFDTLQRVAAGGAGLLGKAFSKASHEGHTFMTVLSGLKMPAIVTALTLLSAGVSSIGAAAVAAVAGLSPLIGLLGALPALYSAFGQGLGTVKLGFQGIGEALKTVTDSTKTAKEIQQALDKLSPAAQTFTMALAGAKKETEQWGKSIQATMLPGFTKGLYALFPIFPVLERGLAKTGGVLGDLAEKAGKMVGGWGPALEKIMGRNARMIRRGFGPALLSLLQILKNLILAGGPLASRLATGLAKAAAHLSDLVREGRKSGALTAFFQRAGDLGGKVWAVLRDISIGLFNVGRNAGSLAGVMGGSIAELAAQFRDWSGSLAGQASIRKFFSDAIPVVKETGALIRDIVVDFARLGSNSDLAPLIKQLRTELLPAATALAGGFTTKLGPAFIDLATAYLQFSNVLSFDPLVSAFKLLGQLVHAISSAIALTPGMSTFVATILTAVVAFRLFAVASRVTGLTKLVTSMTSSTGTIRVFTQALRGNTAALEANQTASSTAAALGTKLKGALFKLGNTVPVLTARLALMSAGQKIMAAGQRVLAFTSRMLGLAFRFMLGPWGLAIAAAAALIVLFVELYKHNARFRAIVQAVAHAIVDFGKAAWKVIKSVAGAVWDVMVKAWQILVPIVTGVFKGIWAVISTYIKVYTTIFKILWLVWKNVFEIIIGLVLIAFRFLLPYIKAGINAIGAVFRWLGGVAAAVWHGISAAAVWLWNLLQAGFQRVMRGLAVIFNAIKRAGQAVWRPIAAVASSVWNRIQAGFARMRDILGGVWDAVKGAAKSAFDWLWKYISPIVDRIKHAFHVMGNALSSVWGGMKDAASSAFDGVKGILNHMISGINHVISGMNKVKIGSDIPSVPYLFTGGAVAAGSRAVVGEHGPETFVPKVGAPRVIGAGGMELTRFSQPGFVVPSPNTNPSVTAPIPDWVTARLEPKAIAVAAPPAAAQPVLVGAAHASAAEEYGPVPQIHNHWHGDGVPTEAEIEAATLRAWRKFDRERRERRL